jgi:hypothetical protein
MRLFVIFRQSEPDEFWDSLIERATGSADVHCELVWMNPGQKTMPTTTALLPTGVVHSDYLADPWYKTQIWRWLDVTGIFEGQKSVTAAHDWATSISAGCVSNTHS